MMLITIIAAMGGTAEPTTQGGSALHPADTTRARQRRPKPAATRRTRSHTPWNIPSSVT